MKKKRLSITVNRLKSRTVSYFCKAMQRHNLFCKFYGFSLLFFCLGFLIQPSEHPFYVSVTEIRSDTAKKTFQVSCRMFTDDLQDALYRKYGFKAELARPQGADADGQLAIYLQERLQITVNGRPVELRWVGYEIEEEATWCYFEAAEFPGMGPVEVQNRLLYDYLSGQTNLIHLYRNGARSSSKLDYPDVRVSFP